MRKQEYHTYLTEQEQLDVIKLLIDLNTALAAIARRKKLKISYI